MWVGCGAWRGRIGVCGGCWRLGGVWARIAMVGVGGVDSFTWWFQTLLISVKQYILQLILPKRPLWG